MEIQTIIWYFFSLLIIISGFVAMACWSNVRCWRQHGGDQQATSNENGEVKPPTIRPTPPLTPAPSYSEFAPPTYESAVSAALPQQQQQQQPLNIFVISIDEKSSTRNFDNDDIRQQQTLAVKLRDNDESSI